MRANLRIWRHDTEGFFFNVTIDILNLCSICFRICSRNISKKNYQTLRMKTFVAIYQNIKLLHMLNYVMNNIYRITAILKVETDIIAYISASQDKLGYL
jgi:hypothetical protein